MYSKYVLSKKSYEEFDNFQQVVSTITQHLMHLNKVHVKAKLWFT